VIAIGSHDVFAGRPPGRAMRLVTEWVELHSDELKSAWLIACDGNTPEQIEPLP
jgi:hypothetical protein